MHAALDFEVRTFWCNINCIVCLQFSYTITITGATSESIAQTSLPTFRQTIIMRFSLLALAAMLATTYAMPADSSAANSILERADDAAERRCCNFNKCVVCASTRQGSKSSRVASVNDDETDCDCSQCDCRPVH